MLNIGTEGFSILVQRGAQYWHRGVLDIGTEGCSILAIGVLNIDTEGCSILHRGVFNIAHGCSILAQRGAQYWQRGVLNIA